MMNPAKLLKMQREAKQLQSKLKENKVVGMSKNEMVKIYMNAAQEFEDIYIDEDLLDPERMDNLKKMFKEAFKDYQKKLQKEMMKDLDLSQLKSMLG